MKQAIFAHRFSARGHLPSLGTLGQVGNFGRRKVHYSRARYMDTSSKHQAAALGALAQRLIAFGPLTEHDQLQIAQASARGVQHPAHASIEIGTERAGAGSRIVASGWIAGAIELADGRRQIVSLHLAGDLLEPEPHGAPLSFFALTAAETFAAAALLGLDEPSRPSERSRVQRGLAAVRAGAIARRLRHIVRLGRLTAYERVADLILELHERQRETTGPESPDGVTVMPLTQEVLADHLGLSNVHTNRMLQQLRQDGLIRQVGRGFAVADVDRLAAARPP